MQNYYTYLYRDPMTKEPFYVGYGSNDRYLDHLREVKCFIDEKINNKEIFKLKGNRNKRFKIKKILEKGQEPVITKVLENVTKEEAIKEEIRLIALYGRKDKGLGPLTNMTDGGDGGDTSFSPNYINSLRNRDASGKNNGMFGISHKDSSKLLIGDKNRDKVCYNNGAINKMFYPDDQPAGWDEGNLLMVGENHPNFGKSWFNNGMDEDKFYPDDQPGGWTKGRLEKIKEKISNTIIKNGSHNGEKNGCYNKTTYYNQKGEERFFVEGTQPDGWVKGKLSKQGKNHHFYGKVGPNKGRKYYNNGMIQGMFYPDTEPENWQKGRLKNAK